jgi:hypothetical protein
VLLRALVAGAGGPDETVTAWRKKTHRLVLVTADVSADPVTNAPRSAGWEPRFVGRPIPADVTELQISVRADSGVRDMQTVAARARELFAELLLEDGVMNRLCRVRFDFAAMPSEGALVVANAIGSLIAKPPTPGWFTRNLAMLPLPVEQRAALRLTETPGIEVSSHWPLARSGPGHAQIYGFVGHRDLRGLGGGEGLKEYLQSFLADRLADGRIAGIVAGYAPGADRIAVDAWLSLGGGRPKLFFPWHERKAADGNGDVRFWLTRDPAEAREEDRVLAEAMENVAECRKSERKGVDPHAAQALDIVEGCDVLVAIHDGRGNNGPGGTGDTIEKARASGRKVVVVSRSGDGARWRNDDPQDTENRRRIEDC